MAKLPGLPAIDPKIPKEIRALLAPMREILTAYADPNNPVIRARALVEAGVIAGFDNTTASPPSSAYGVPPAPTGLSAAGALASIILTWDATGYQFLSHTEIWRAPTNNFASAQLVGNSTGRVYVDTVGGGATRYYWIRHVSRGEPPQTGAFNAQSGVMGQTGYDASYLLDVLSADPPDGSDYSPLLYVQPTEITIGGVVIPAGVYMTSAYIRDLSITDAHVAELSADKLYAGDIAAARMSANIVEATTGRFSALSALTSNLGTVTIDSAGFLNSQGATAYNSGNGIWMGYDSGNYKFRVGSPSGSSIRWDGASLVVRGTLMGDNGYFKGDITGANGTFSGTLAANTVTTENIISRACTSLEMAINASGNGSIAIPFFMDHAGYVVAHGYCNYAFSSSTSTATTFEYRININGSGENSLVGSDSGFNPAYEAQAATVGSFAAGWHTINVYLFHSAVNGNHVNYVNIYRSYR